MTVPASELESHTATSDIVAADGGPQVEKVAGRSPTQLAMARFRKDRLSMVSLVIVGIYMILALSAPLLVHFGVLNPFSFHNREN
jgi:peptide/nickel transport system permease protein